MQNVGLIDAARDQRRRAFRLCHSTFFFVVLFFQFNFFDLIVVPSYFHLQSLFVPCFYLIN